MKSSTPFTVEFTVSANPKPGQKAFFSDGLAQAQALKEEIQKDPNTPSEKYFRCAQLFLNERVANEALSIAKEGLIARHKNAETPGQLRDLIREISKREEHFSGNPNATPMFFKSAISRNKMVRRMSTLLTDPETKAPILKLEAKRVLSMFQRMKETEYLSKEFNVVYLISSKWLNHWKVFTGFSEMTGEKLHSIEGLGLNEKSPPNIDNTDLIDTNLRLLIDPLVYKSYTNSVLKNDLIENENFCFVSQELWEFFREKYGNSDEIKRYVICTNDEKNTCAVEVRLKKIKFLPLSFKKQKSLDNGRADWSNPKSILASNTWTVCLSRLETVKSLKEKILRGLKAKFASEFNGDPEPKPTIWKFRSQESLISFINGFSEIRNRGSPIPQKMTAYDASILENSELLQDSEINEEDILVFEFPCEELKISLPGPEQAVPEEICGNCNKTTGLKFCQCLSVRYCSQKCQKAQRKKHREKCIELMIELEKKRSLMKRSKNSQNVLTKDSKTGLVGLSNIGNTCYMNSSLQCLASFRELHSFFVQDDFAKDLNTTNFLGTKGEFANAFGDLLKQMWFGSKDWIAPWGIKKVISKFASQFDGYSQQDAQEFMSYALDCLHEDLNRVKKREVVPLVEGDGTKSDEEVSGLAWEAHLKRNDSKIVELLHGQYKSKIVCPDCAKTSITFDPFSILSLNVPTSDFITVEVFLFFRSTLIRPLKISVRLDGEKNLKFLLSLIYRKYFVEAAEEINSSRVQDKQSSLVLDESNVLQKPLSPLPAPSLYEFMFALIQENKIIEKFEEICFESTKVETLNKAQGVIFLYQLYDPQNQAYSDFHQVSPTSSLTLTQIPSLENRSLLQISLRRKLDDEFLNSLLIIELLFTQARPEAEDDRLPVSFERCILVKKSIFLQEVGLEVYKYMRPFLANLGQNLPESPFKGLKDKGKSEEDVLLEYLNLFYNGDGTIKTDESVPYQLCYLKGEEIFVVEHSNKGTLAEVFGKERTVKMSIDFDKSIHTDNLLMAKCFSKNYLEEPYAEKVDVNLCLSSFSKEEQLDEMNSWYCPACKSHKQAMKSIFLYKAPPLLIIHFKRFRTRQVYKVGSLHVAGQAEKVTIPIDFPIENLDLGPFVQSSRGKELIYDLVGVCNHQGFMGSGHYIAYAKAHNGGWYEFNDGLVTKIEMTKIVSPAAYVLFYRLRSF